ncbi:MAG TPA: hopanoid-associated sugar epimerase [Skermanella sp.]|jgi:dihydroflavonol-4-reductase|nr:hopanoid-associated sugar epimerase [Skermanella sp.]
MRVEDIGGTVLVTGASGFVGSAVAKALAARGVQVRLLVRSTSNRRNLSGLGDGTEIATGSLEDPASLRAAITGCKALFHVAADYRIWVPDPDAMMRTNVEGTRSLMRESLAAGVERIVYTSSVATLGLKPDRSPADEDTPERPGDIVGPYKRSKYEAEQVVRRMAAEDGLPAVIVNPSTPVGPRDVKPTPTGRIIVEAASGRMPAYVDTGLNLVHVDDVAAGHLLAFEHGRIGERYILGGDNLTLAEMLGEIARLAGRTPPRVRLPTAPLFPLAVVAEGIARLTGKEPFLTRDGLRMAAKLMFFSSAKAERELNYRHRPASTGLEDALNWFRDAGYVR